MKVIIATEEVLSPSGRVMFIIYHYSDGSTKKKRVYTPVKK